ncbi:MAG: aminotransferase class V-fold PLP-dependent enzyme [Planctomycetaceae bacterium]|nr:aminotransferase class V-fold PLP-dependent enzyme [Planctomycetaceae bacterium]
MIYLDNNATTNVAPEVLETMLPFFKEEYYNPSSMYGAAKLARYAVESARNTFAGELKTAHNSEIIFTSCATESINAAIFGAAKANPERRHIVTTAVEHPAVLEVCKQLQRDGYEVSIIGVDRDGNIDLHEFIRELQPETLLVAIMHANNETGVIFPIEQLAGITKETSRKILFFCDITQTFTKVPVNVCGNFRDVDMLAFSGHKFHAPKGVGALYIRRGTPCRSFFIGGHQEFGRRAGTENVALIAGMAKAVDAAAEHHQSDAERIETLRNKLQNGIIERIPNVEVNGLNAERMPNTLNVAVHYVEGESMLTMLDELEICVSSGSACTSGSLEPSHVLTAMGVPFTAMHGSVRFSLSRYNTEEEIDFVLEHFPKVVANLRRMSPYWDQGNNCPREETSGGGS